MRIILEQNIVDMYVFTDTNPESGCPLDLLRGS